MVSTLLETTCMVLAGFSGCVAQDKSRDNIDREVNDTIPCKPPTCSSVGICPFY